MHILTDFRLCVLKANLRWRERGREKERGREEGGWEGGGRERGLRKDCTM